MTTITLLNGKKFKVAESPSNIKSRMYFVVSRNETHLLLTKDNGQELLVAPGHIVSAEENG